MMDHKLLDILNGKLNEQVQQLVDVVSAGGAKSHEHYKDCAELSEVCKPHRWKLLTS